MDQQLLVFVATVERRSFSRAAEDLHMTQPGVSQQIRSLERSLNARLLDRHQKGVRLTKAGEIVYYHAKQILGLYGRMEQLVGDLLHEEFGSLAIGASYTFGEYVLPRLIARFRERHPRIAPTISVANSRDVVDRVARGLLDVGIIEGQYGNRSVEVSGFAADQVVVVVPSYHPLTQVAGITAEILSREPWILREEGSGTREVTDRLLTRYHIVPTCKTEFASTQMVKEAVEAGLGVSVLSRWAIRKELALKTLVVLPFPDEPVTRPFALALPVSDFRTRAMALFADFVHEEAKHIDDL
ncbi:MAG: LysR family transcriptional regulator [Thermaerobacter sp.]|nr:LysR family transcriptional regulator [Thermaerobacter sp.]